jgi:hypothetical protein
VCVKNSDIAAGKIRQIIKEFEQVNR